jgi:hypothetical protein
MTQAQSIPLDENGSEVRRVAGPLPVAISLVDEFAFYSASGTFNLSKNDRVSFMSIARQLAHQI